MTLQTSKLVLRKADTSSDLPSMSVYKFSREDKQRIAQEAKEFKTWMDAYMQHPAFPHIGDYIHELQRTIVENILFVEPTFHIVTPEEATMLSKVPDFIMLDKEKAFEVEVRTYEVDWKTLQPPSAPEREAFETERQAFLRIKDSLLDHPEYRGKFVAVYEGNVIDQGEDNRELAKRVYSRYGYVPIYIDKVERERRVIEMPSPESG